MIRIGDRIDPARRASLVALITAAIGRDRDKLARERVIALAPAGIVTPDLADYVTRLLALSVDRCAVCLEPCAGLHPACATRHADELARAEVTTWRPQ